MQEGDVAKGKEKKGGKKRIGKKRKTRQRKLLWVGARVPAPAVITGRDPFRPDLIVWMEMPRCPVVGMELVDPRTPKETPATVLIRSFSSPMVGGPRRPAKVRVPDEETAEEIRRAVPDLEVVVGPIPEIDRLIRAMQEDMCAGEEEPAFSYLEKGRISPQVLESFFDAAKLLYETAPWTKASDMQVLRMDIPSLGVKGACLSILGAAGESFGIVIFPSFTAFERWLEVAEKAPDLSGPIDLGTSTLSLNYERGADLPKTLRREIAEYGWAVADQRAYPWVQKRDRDGMMLPLTEKDVKTVAAAANGLAAFMVKNGDLFTKELLEPVCESYFDERGLEVRFTAPYHAWELFGINDPPTDG